MGLDRGGRLRSETSATGVKSVDEQVWEAVLVEGNLVCTTIFGSCFSCIRLWVCGEGRAG